MWVRYPARSLILSTAKSEARHVERPRRRSASPKSQRATLPHRILLWRSALRSGMLVFCRCNRFLGNESAYIPGMDRRSQAEL